MPIRCIVFDFMGVIFEDADDTRDLLVPYIQQRNDAITQEQIVDLYIQTSLGHMLSADLWQECGLGNYYPAVEKDYLDSCLRLDPDFIATAEQLSQNYSLAVLSNDVAEWNQYLRTKYDMYRLFDAIVISGEVGYRKPDAAIYQILLNRAMCTAESCLFIDDSAKNLKAASEQGIKTCLFARQPYTDDYKPDYQVNGFAALPPLLQELS